MLTYLTILSIPAYVAKYTWLLIYLCMPVSLKHLPQHTHINYSILNCLFRSQDIFISKLEKKMSNIAFPLDLHHDMITDVITFRSL